MTTNSSTARRTSPFHLFPFKKCLDPILFHKFKILNHTHSKVSPVAPIDTLQSITWKTFALMTVVHFLVKKKIALFLQESTVLLSWPTPNTIGDPNSFILQIKLRSKITTAYSTVHSTGSYQSRKVFR